jgi:FlaA1/EpsC-like NDP-sugar epimerase
VRDKESLRYPCQGADVIFHVAALKHVDIVEDNPHEGFKTNVNGTINVAEMAMELCVPDVVFSSTDKAVLPINTYGFTKALSEKYLLNLNKRDQPTKFSVFRWGNVLGSRGSVVHLFSKSLDDGRICLTHTDMSRFWIHISDAVKFMLDNYLEADVDRVMIPPMRASTVVRLADAIARFKGVKDYDMEVTGIRDGEKIHEQLESNHDYCLRSDNCAQYTDAELDDMVRAVL